MAKAKRLAGKVVRARRASGRENTPRRQNAVALLKADHRQVEEWFAQFESARAGERRNHLLRQICQALKVHTRIEEEIFYPAFLKATGEKDIHHEAEIEHGGAKNLIADIETAGLDDDYLDARVKVLSEMIKHHVREEEKSGGMFSKARGAGMDLMALSEQLAARKAELMADETAAELKMQPRSRRTQAEPRA
jgi:hemerythrin superfamily protein